MVRSRSSCKGAIRRGHLTVSGVQLCMPNDLCLLDLQTRTETVVVARTAERPCSAVPRGLRTVPGSRSPGSAQKAMMQHISTARSGQADGTELDCHPNTYPLGTERRGLPMGQTISYTERDDGRNGEDSGRARGPSVPTAPRTQVTSRKGHLPVRPWSSDGQRTGFESVGVYYPYQAGLWTMGRDGRARVRRRSRRDAELAHASMRLRRRIRLRWQRGRRSAYVAAHLQRLYDLFTVRPDGNEVRRLTDRWGELSRQPGRRTTPEWPTSNRPRTSRQ